MKELALAESHDEQKPLKILAKFLADNPPMIIPVVKYFLNIKMTVGDAIGLTQTYDTTHINFPFDGDKRRETPKSGIIRKMRQRFSPH